MLNGSLTMLFRIKRRTRQQGSSSGEAREFGIYGDFGRSRGALICLALGVTSQLQLK